jgi:hypothetical protein
MSSRTESLEQQASIIVG